MRLAFILLVLVAVVAACAPQENLCLGKNCPSGTECIVTNGNASCEKIEPRSETRFECEDPRPEVCTEQYDPVCGSDNKTYSNGCTACSNEKIDSYTLGACAAYPEQPKNMPENAEPCIERPDICYEIYQPVCGSDKTTYANDCKACAAGVAWHVPGECDADAGFVRCEETRSEICTREYNPVCAQVDTGIRCITEPCPSSEWETYGNECEACSDPDVLGWKRGRCADIQDCDEGEDRYAQQLGMACIQHYGENDLRNLPVCETAGDCIPEDVCGYPRRTTDDVEVDIGLRCLPSDYQDYLLHTSGLTVVDENGDESTMIA